MNPGANSFFSFAAQTVSAGQERSATRAMTTPNAEVGVATALNTNPPTRRPVRFRPRPASTVQTPARHRPIADTSESTHTRAGPRPRRSRLSAEERTSIAFHKQLFNKAHKESQKLVERLECLLVKGKRSQALKLQRKLLKSFYVKLVAFETANKKLPPRRRISTTDLVAAARRLDAWAPELEEVMLRVEKKDTGGNRPIFDFGIQHRARQYLCRMALQPFLRPAIRSDQYGTASRGVDTAIAKIADGMESTEYKFFSEGDITSFYQNIGEPNPLAQNTISIFDWLPLPEAVIRHCVISKHFIINNRSSYISVTECISQTMVSRQGIPHGSPVSSLIADYVMGLICSDAAPELPGDVSLVGYADNTGILGTTRKSVERAMRTLERSMERCPLGHFRLKRGARIKRHDHGFNFLGYHLRSRRHLGRLTMDVTATEKNEGKYRIKMRKLLKASRASSWAPAEVRERNVKAIAEAARSWCASRQMSPDIKAKALRLALNEALSVGLSVDGSLTTMVRDAFVGLFGERFVRRVLR